MFSSFKDVVRSKKNFELPEVAKKHFLYKRNANIATLTSYANSLLYKYPEQYELINDIASAGLLLDSYQNIKELQEQLIDLERYLFDTK